MAAAASAAEVHPWPTGPQPALSAVACRARAAGLAADAAVCLFIANMWLVFLGLAAVEVGELACGDCEDSPVSTAGARVAAVAAMTLGPVFVFAVRCAAGAGAATDIEAAKPPAQKSFDAAVRETLRDPMMLAVLASTAFSLLMVVGALVEGNPPVKGSRRERMGSVICLVATLGMDAVSCFVICPILTVKTWSVMRQHS